MRARHSSSRRQTGDISTAARALDVLGTVYMFPDPAGARPGLEQARELALESGDDWCFVDATQILASTLVMQADLGCGRRVGGGIRDPRAQADMPSSRPGTGGGSAPCGSWRAATMRRSSCSRARSSVADAVGEPVSSGASHASRTLTRCDRGEAQEVLAELGPVMERSIAAGAGLAIPWLRTGDASPRGPRSASWSRRARRCRSTSASGASGGPYGTVIALTLLGRIELSLGEFERRGRACPQRRSRSPTARSAIRSTAPRRARSWRPWRSPAATRPRPSASPTKRSPTAVQRGYRPLIAPALDVLAVVAASLESFEEAARIVGAAQRALEELGHVRWEREQATADALRRASASHARRATSTTRRSRQGTSSAPTRRSAGCGARGARASAHRAAGSR